MTVKGWKRGVEVGDGWRLQEGKMKQKNIEKEEVDWWREIEETSDRKVEEMGGIDAVHGPPAPLWLIHRVFKEQQSRGKNESS